MRILEKKKDKIKALAKRITTIVTDVDGVLTDGYLTITEQEEEPFGKFSIMDGIAIVLAHDCGIRIIVISGRKSLCAEARCRKLGLDEIYTGVSDKSSKLQEISKRLQLDMSEVAYIGDDLIDLRVMGLCGFTIAPRNAVKVVKQHVDYITKVKGGDGALREVVELVLKSQKRFKKYIKQYF
jgi:3-deoxy-D-manno-octulosonate 8-phosphate phosphatase (KDO 8-P phosphatase)